MRRHTVRETCARELEEMAREYRARAVYLCRRADATRCSWPASCAEDEVLASQLVVRASVLDEAAGRLRRGA